jgi:hypothetical protein
MSTKLNVFNDAAGMLLRHTVEELSMDSYRNGACYCQYSYGLAAKMERRSSFLFPILIHYYQCISYRSKPSRGQSANRRETLEKVIQISDQIQHGTKETTRDEKQTFHSYTI